MDIHLSQPQFEFTNTLSKSTALVAGYGSGKTEVAVIDMLLEMFKYPGADMLYLAPTFPLIFDIFYPKIDAILAQMGVRYKINYSKNNVHIAGCGIIRCRTMEHPHRLIGFECLHAYIDEIDVLPEEKALLVWQKVKARCRQKVKGVTNKMKITTTPEGYKFVYNAFKKEPITGSHLIHCSTYSNAHNLPDDYISDLKANYPANLIKAYLMGLFVNLVNMPVWECYDADLNNSTETVRGNEPLTVGMDFNVGRGCAVLYAHRDYLVDHPKHPKNTWYHERAAVWQAARIPLAEIQVKLKNMALREVAPYETMHAVGEVVDSYDTPDTIRALQEHYANNPLTIIPDASGDSRKSVNATTSDIALLKEAGYEVIKNNKNPAIKDRVSATNRMFCNGLQQRQLFVNKQWVPHFSDGLIKQVYDKNLLPEKGNGKKDDITDAGTYPIAHLHPIKKLTTTSREI